MGIQLIFSTLAWLLLCSSAMASSLPYTFTITPSLEQQRNVLKIEHVGGESTMNQGRDDNLAIKRDANGVFVNVTAQPLTEGNPYVTMNFSFHAEILRYLVPTGMGVAISPEQTNLGLMWPETWSAALIVAELKSGGVVAIWCRDAAYPFKQLLFKGNDGISIRILKNKDHLVRSNWSLKWYGNWQSAAEAFRHDAMKVRLSQIPPRTNDIENIVVQRLDITKVSAAEQLHSLAKRYAPKKTLLYWPLWRISGDSGFDEDYPSYTPKPHIEEAIATAHQLGFRVMLHFNTDFVSMRSPQKSSLWNDRLLRWSPSGCINPIIYHNPKYPERDSFKMDRGSVHWLDTMLDAIQTQYTKLHFDAVHLDVSVSIPAACDGGGITGTKKLLSQIKSSFPNLLIGGEAINEVTYEDTDIYQSLPANISGWPMQLRGIGQSHPIGLKIFSPAKSYAHLHAASVDRDGVERLRFYDSFEKMNDFELQKLLIPTFWDSTSNLN